MPIKRLKSHIIALLLCILPLFVWAQEEPIPVEQAFQLRIQAVAPDTLIAHWDIAKGYFLYKAYFKFKVLSPDNAQLGEPFLPPAETKNSDLLGDYEVYGGQVNIRIPVKDPTPAKLEMVVHYQGCSESGYCYPPVDKVADIALQSGTMATIKDAPKGVTAADDTQKTTATSDDSQQDKITELLAHRHFFTIVFAFFVFGLLLAFTPCVLPMIPILSSIIAGHSHKISTLHAFLLSLTYVLSMSVTFALAGVLAGLAGYSVQAALQNPWVISVFAVLFVLLAFSLFGFFELRLPHKWENRINQFSQTQRGGSHIGVAVMGILATLIVSPCVSAPLVGALGYIGSTGNALLGGVALFCMGLGMGVPLLIIGTSAGKLLPKAGPWMDTVKSVFGVMILAMGIWFLDRVIPGAISLFLWGVLLIVSGVYMGAFRNIPEVKWFRLWKGLGIVLAIYGTLLLVGAARGQDNPLAPLGGAWTNCVKAFTATGKGSEETPHNAFKPVKSIQDLQAALAQAKAQQQPVLLDFYADWCIDCKEMDKRVFEDAQVQAALKNVVLLRADVTKNDATDKALQKSLKVYAPPTLVFYNQQGDESQRVVGGIGAKTFLEHLQKATQ